ncbi:MAG: gamma carbonic anhydrase family protein [Acidimicrobiia bacterium]|nr:gamma carbonic anhydrase family protein [Acidimicrobiia bacterium]
MPLYALGELVPRIHPDAFVHPEAVVIGDVEVGAESSVWPGAVLRGDDGPITVGERTSIQDGAIIHTWVEHPTRIGSGCVIGHLAHLEGCHIGDNALVGSAAVVLRRAIVSSWSLVGAGALVAPGKVVPEGAQAVGVPAVIKEGRADREDIADSARKYVERVHRYRAGLRQL